MRNIRLDLLVLCGAFTLSFFPVRFAGSEEAAAESPPLSTHILNTTTGKPASGVPLVLQKQTGGGWEDLRKAKTDEKGRASDLYIPGKALKAGTYRLIFETGDYFKTQGVSTFFPRVEIVFVIEKTEEHYHIPLLISPFGYSTYRGS
jgi:5-hydroxyisourate hydrolase